MIHLDTNFLILALVPGSAQDNRLRAWLAGGEAVNVDVMVWAEFLCGPVAPHHVALASALLPNPEALTAADAARAAELYNATGRRRGSLSDCLIAATCIRLGVPLASDNAQDFRRFESMGLRLAS